MAPCILSPGRRLFRKNNQNHQNATIPPAVQDLFSFTPNELLDLHHSMTNYICGVAGGANDRVSSDISGISGISGISDNPKICTQLLRCSLHTDEQKRLVVRQYPFEELLATESGNSNRRRLVAAYIHHKWFWENLSSCGHRQPVCDTCTSRSGKSMRQIYLSQLLRAPNMWRSEIVAYLHLRLKRKCT